MILFLDEVNSNHRLDSAPRVHRRNNVFGHEWSQQEGFNKDLVGQGAQGTRATPAPRPRHPLQDCPLFVRVRGAGILTLSAANPHAAQYISAKETRDARRKMFDDSGFLEFLEFLEN